MFVKILITAACLTVFGKITTTQTAQKEKTQKNIHVDSLPPIEYITHLMRNGTPLMIDHPSGLEFKYAFNVPEIASDITAFEWSEQISKPIPPSVWKAQNLKALFLVRDSLKNLPNDISKLVNLKYLDIDENQLTGVPMTLGNLTKLRVLNLNKNNIAVFPDVVCKLVNLQQLALSNNQLSSLSNGFGQLTQLQYLSIIMGRSSNIF